MYISLCSEKNIFINEPMCNHTTFKTGGNADYLVIPQNKNEMVKLLKLDITKTIMQVFTQIQLVV